MVSDPFPGHTVAITLRFGGRSRHLTLQTWLAVALLGALCLGGVWSLCASAYFVFHDQMLAALISRQSDLQYAYEDRIASLRTRLDRETSSGLIDRHTLATAVKDLETRGMRLEARATMIEGLVAHDLHDPKAAFVSQSAAPDSGSQGLDPDATGSLALPDPGLRMDAPTDATGTAGKRADLLQSEMGVVAGLLGRIETRQGAVVAALRAPLGDHVTRLRTALSESGLPRRVWDDPAPATNVGGPFVPLPASVAGDDTDAQIAILKDEAEEAARLDAVVDHVPLRRPLDGPLTVTSPFGSRLDPFYGRPALHTGTDFLGGYGGAVEATASGTVTIAGQDGGYGNMVEIDHGNGLTTRYAHLASIEVSIHQRVHVGELVGRIGATGRATGPHLHYETRVNGEPVDPSRFLRAGSPLAPG
jgi:murein DD-endopeptidase MepM/ murein hydrolase activator NlpD